MNLHDLKPRSGAKRPRTRVGRGIAAGKGKTAGRGTKGEGARAGSGGHLYRQGGNLPFYRSLPVKRGFTNIRKVEWNEVNLDQLALFPAGTEVTPEVLAQAKLIDPGKPTVLLGRGQAKAALKIRVQRVSRSARAKLEKAGGSVEIIPA